MTTDSEESLIGLYTRVSNLENNGIPGVRDFFATSALSFLANGRWTELTYSEVAKKAYHIADAMMLERSKGGTKNPQ